MRTTMLITLTAMIGHAAIAQAASGNAEAGRQLVMRSCSSCHATESAKTATDNAPPFSAVAKSNRERPAWIRGWLMSPHPPMPNISLSRQQIDDIVAYLGTLPSD
jgi:mono/diheme cytochrome c family protein